MINNAERQEGLRTSLLGSDSESELSVLYGRWFKAFIGAVSILGRPKECHEMRIGQVLGFKIMADSNLMITTIGDFEQKLTSSQNIWTNTKGGLLGNMETTFQWIR